jgi:hypothetical protein
MFHEYALDPACVNDWSTFKHLVDQCGFQHGRLISRFPRKWQKEAIAAALAGGFFIDIDHLFDYFYQDGLRGFDLHRFLSGKYFDDAGKVYLWFHGYEYAAALLLASAAIDSQRWLLLSVGAAMSCHLLYDLHHNSPNPQAYSIAYRLSQKFNIEKFSFHSRKKHKAPPPKK